MTNEKNSIKLPWLLRVYLIFSKSNAILYRYLLRNRLKKGKEDPERVSERLGQTSRPRPDGNLIWFNAVSIGEALALQPVIDNLLSRNRSLNILVTTTTVTSAKIMEELLPDRAIHQFCPVDTECAVTSFLDHWRPDTAVWCESELWPRLIIQTTNRAIPMYIINARISSRSAKTWQKFPKTIKAILNNFDTIFVNDKGTLNVINKIGVDEKKLVLSGSTKETKIALSYCQTDFDEIRSQIGHRNVWLAASTHDGEEEILFEAQKSLALEMTSPPLLILAPRHPNRANGISKLANLNGLHVALRSKSDLIDKDTDVYIADTLGEMGLWYNLSTVSFVGGSLVEVGGHNPYEPIACSSAIITGPNVHNFREIYGDLLANNACQVAKNVSEISSSIKLLLDTEINRKQISHAKSLINETSTATGLISDKISANINSSSSDLNKGDPAY